MKRKEITSLHDMKVEELKKKITEESKALAQMKRDRYTKQSKNVRASKTSRITIARLKTVLRVKELSV
jgi:ribosomal protein L29